MRKILIFCALFLINAYAQDSINVTFRYATNSSVIRVFVPGEFNNWGPNSSGRIAVNAPSLMTLENGIWYKIVRLKIGGGTATINNEKVYQYKIHEHLNSDGSSYSWLSDPINPKTNAADNNNSYFAVKHPMIFQIEPTASKTLRNNQPAITATVAAKNSDSIDVNLSSIYINDVLVGTFGSYYNRAKQLLSVPSLSVFNAALNSGLNELKIVAVTKSGSTRADSIQVNYVVNPPIVNEAVPAGIIDGIDYSADPTKATLCLFAPYKKFVYVLGDFNNWTVNSNYFMKRDSIAPDSIRWWHTLSPLIPQKEYGFQYFIDDEIRIADPYTEKTLDAGNDAYNPIPYPTGKTDHAVSVLQTAQNRYKWQVTDFQRPAASGLVIYELLLRDFLAAHNFNTLTDTLSYLKKLGINAIELMPINEFDGNESWGYNPAFYFAPDKYYGKADHLKQFIDACHSMGMAVIIDMVLNHSYGQSPFVRLYNEGEYGKPTSENPWYNVNSPNPVYSWGYDFNHQSKATQTLVDRINHHWLTEFKVDGFRFDFTKGFTNTAGDGWAYDGARIAILKRMADQIWQASPQAYVILEHFADNNEEKNLSDYGMLLWGNLNSKYSEASMGWHNDNKSDLSWGFYKTRGWNKAGLVTYMESHDEERLVYKNLQYGNSSGGYSTRDLNTALQRIKMAAAFFLTLPGPKMIWHFGELGYDYSIEYNGRVGNKPIRWDYFQQKERKRLYKAIAAINKLRAENEVFRSEGTTVNLSLLGAVKRINLLHGTLNVAIVGNFGVTTLSVNPNFAHTGSWYDYFSGDTIGVSAVNDLLSLQAGEFHIYTDRKLETPAEDLISAIDEEDFESLPLVFSLKQNYPNPFNPLTSINYEVQENGRVELRVYDINGREAATLVSEYKIAGRYQVIFNGSGLSSGLYFYRLQAGSFTAVKRMLLIK